MCRFLLCDGTDDMPGLQVGAEPDGASRVLAPRFLGIIVNLIMLPPSMLPSLQDVSERGIFPIRHILPILTSLGFVTLAAHAVFLVAPCILPPVIEHEDDGDKGTGADGGHDGDLGGDVLRRIAGLESLRSDDIAQVESTGGESGDDGPLRVAGNICGHPAVHDRRHRDVELDQ